ncbi:ubiquitin-conjugating enzyme [Nadsonia fulvescens var. elongata DSM 6958]|uniref:Ubiquitin-conjugating enzyme n=1 Tax=Nadsonia fulvescens var. elongata DSM 6958 TaxID=857566 RepID=A0A1E3PIC2_9ASCO|nr:ubiquitin-conjugating enzyme [Nadsonia fulvescens var. elongata DSM 6958]
MAARRLIRELAAFSADPNPALALLEPTSSSNLFQWRAVLRGPAAPSPYEGGLWEIIISIPESYPLSPPTMKFKTKIVHPNIHLETGEVCLDVLKSQWSPAWTISSACTAVQAMLSDPEPDSPLNVDAANLLRCGEFSGYNALIHYYIITYGLSEKEAC